MLPFLLQFFEIRAAFASVSVSPVGAWGFSPTDRAIDAIGL
jgi:hypothetical protein